MRKFLLCIIIVFISLNCSAQDTTLSRMYVDISNKLFYKKDYEAALKNLALAIIENPNNVDAYSRRATIYNITKNPDLELADLSTLIKLQKNDSYPLYRRATFYKDEKKYKEALEDYTAAIKIRPDAFNYSGRAGFYRYTSKLDEAIADYKKAASLSPGSLYNQYLAELYYDQKKYETALEYANVAVQQVKPNSGLLGFGSDQKAFFMRGKIYYAQKNYEAAEKDFSKYIEDIGSIFFENDAYYYRAMSYCVLGEYEKVAADEKNYKLRAGKNIIVCDKTKTVKTPTIQAPTIPSSWKKYDLTGTGLSISSPQPMKMVTNVPDPFIETQNAFVSWSGKWDDFYVSVTYEGSTNNITARDKLERRKKYFLENNKNATATISGSKILGHPALLFYGEKMDAKKKMINEEIMYGEFGNLTSIYISYPADDKAAKTTADNLFKSLKEDGTLVKSIKLQPDTDWTKFNFNGLEYSIPTRNEEGNCDIYFGKSDANQTSINACYDWEKELQIKVGYKMYKNFNVAIPSPFAASLKREEKEKVMDDIMGAAVGNTYYKKTGLLIPGGEGSRLTKTNIVATIAIITDYLFIKKGNKTWEIIVDGGDTKNYLKEARNKIITSIALKD